ncbi:unnamed protein product [Enterobius vermicularis]|uniref:TIR domain-containing protein n=1 Tax=Enterobius vermicularis TaxID=51028 RepID=A0A0N4V0F5_ENTVE|nr:unnamed protein product [Enterobius vermicularis]
MVQVCCHGIAVETESTTQENCVLASPGTQQYPLLAVSSGSGFSCQNISPYRTFGKILESQTPFYDVFLGGSCGNTVWRKEEVIPFLEKRGISYFDPQKSVWDQNMIGEEDVAKENSRLILFVIDPTTINATSYLEIAHIAARQMPKMVVVFLNQLLWQSNGLPEDRSDRKRVCETLDDILTMHHVPVLHTIKEALHYIDEAILGQKTWSEAMANPLQRLPFIMLKGRRVFQQSAHKIAHAWQIVRNGFCRWSGSKFIFIVFLELLMVLAVHFSVHNFPIVFILLPLIALDALLAILVLLYYRYKASVASKQRAYIMQQRVLVTKGSIAIPGRSVVPCELQTSVSAKVTKFKKMVAASDKQKRAPKKGSQCSFHEKYCWKARSDTDLYLACSSTRESDLAYMNKTAEKFFRQVYFKKSWKVKFEKDPSPEGSKRMNTMSSARHIIYYFPTAESMLSGMVEIAYMFGKVSWRVTICLPPEDRRCIRTSSKDARLKEEYQYRNSCYKTAFLYLQAMGKDKNCQIFEKLDDALQHAYSCISS